MSGEARVPEQEDIENVRGFFDQWSIYRRVIDRNYLHHREAYAEVRRVLGGFGRSLRILDLGSGDASFMAGALGECDVAAYHAVDVSPVALSLARENIGRRGCLATFAEADFFTYVPAMEELFDVVYIGLSLHHLPLANKQSFFAELRRVVKPDGCLMIFEPICRPDESRPAVLDRWWEVISRSWTELAAEDLAALKDHVFGNDYPESLDTYRELGRAAGFPAMSVPFASADELYASMEFRAQA